MHTQGHAQAKVSANTLDRTRVLMNHWRLITLQLRDGWHLCFRPQQQLTDVGAHCSQVV